MYEISSQEGIVLGRRAAREADFIVDVLTPAGLLRADARAARAERSKLRYGLEPLTHGRFSLVRGKNSWRLTGVDAVDRRWAAASAPARGAMGRICRLLVRLVQGVEPSPELFRVAVEGFDALARSPHPESTEVVLVLRILSHLGYLPHTEALAPFIEGGFSIELSAKALESRSLLVRAINESLKATGL